MAENKENDGIEITSEELIAAAVYVRTNGLLSILNDDLKEEAQLSMGPNGLPCIDAVVGGLGCRISYFPVGDEETDRFILMIRVAVLPGDEASDHTKRLLSCETYNVGSVFGTAVFIPTDGSVEFRVTVPERGGMQEPSFYRFVLDMVINGTSELADLLEED